MIKKGFRRLPIVKDNILIGIITASDIMRYLGNGDVFQKLMTKNSTDAFQIPIKGLILRDIVWTPSNIDIGEAAALMLNNKVGALPIIDDGELCGILTERDIIKALAD
jgi:CBS domain-containing protein